MAIVDNWQVSSFSLTKTDLVTKTVNCYKNSHVSLLISLPDQQIVYNVVITWNKQLILPSASCPDFLDRLQKEVQLYLSFHYTLKQVISWAWEFQEFVRFAKGSGTVMTRLYINIPIPPIGILDFCKQKWKHFMTLPCTCRSDKKCWDPLKDAHEV